MILTRAQIYDVNAAIQTIDNFKTKEMSKFFLLEIYNIETVLSQEIQNIQKAFTPSKEFQEFEYKRNELIRKYAVVKADGNYSIIGDKIEIKEGSLDAFKAEIQVLAESYNEAIRDNKKSLKEFEELLNTTTDVKINKIDFKLIPEFISKQVFDWLKPVINFPGSE